MLFHTKAEKNTKKKTDRKNSKNRRNVPGFLQQPEKKGTPGKSSVPYSLEEMMFYDDIIYDEW